MKRLQMENGRTARTERQQTYLFRANPEEFDTLLPVHSSDWDLFGDFDGRSLQAGWKPVQMKVFQVGNRGDFPYLSSRVPVLSQRAWDILRLLIQDAVEALPVRTADTTYYAINVTRLLDCLDLERSGVEWLEPGQILDVDDYVLKAGCLHGEPIFKVLGMERMDVLVSEGFKEQVERAGLKGARFIPVGLETGSGGERTDGK